MKKWDELPKDIQDRMLECQKEQGKNSDADAFKFSIRSGSELGGFNWGKTIEGWNIWDEALNEGNYQPFYDFHNKPKEITFSDLGIEIWDKPKLMKVRDGDDESRISFAWVIGKSDNYFMSKGYGDSINKPFSWNKENVLLWFYAEEIKEEAKHEEHLLMRIVALEKAIEELQSKRNDNPINSI
jgi:hypothetical protein